MKSVGAFIMVAGLVSCDAARVDATGKEGEESSTADPAVEVEMATRSTESLYGHLAYGETDATLADAGGYRNTGRVVQLRVEAAEAFRAMQDAAREAGVHIMPISGFRTRSYQDVLFSRAIMKYGNTELAARWVAPPGYSEHHTGLALDIADSERPETDVETTFEDTPAYSWLKDNAHRFEFELSFPRDNPQGVSYEPWHWRFTGVPDAPGSP